MFQDFPQNPMGIFIQNVPTGRKPHGENLMFEFDGITVLLIYFDRYAFQICEKNRNLFIIIFPMGNISLENLRGKIPTGKVIISRGDLFSPQGFRKPRGDFDLYC